MKYVFGLALLALSLSAVETSAQSKVISITSYSISGGWVPPSGSLESTQTFRYGPNFEDLNSALSYGTLNLASEIQSLKDAGNEILEYSAYVKSFRSSVFSPTPFKVFYYCSISVKVLDKEAVRQRIAAGNF